MEAILDNQGRRYLNPPNLQFSWEVFMDSKIFLDRLEM